ncbi:unnamed protein product [Heligmosomoides polygyrus]|uniref:Reverse transcriptase domain-containing protein n=1 Tax=Heligmosomoides polygyrus TaxID=6339 RepID=A0A183FYS4_HELPZ|nr:unnamed protein product [Heligmosomoides polygyrus]
MSSMRGSLIRGRHRGETELARKFRNVGKTRIAALNVGTLTGRSCELAEALERKRVDLCAVQKTSSPRITSGVGVIVSERYGDAIISGLPKIVTAVTTVLDMEHVTLMHRDRKLITDAKVVSYETVATQHRPLICTIKFAPPRLRHVERCGPPRVKCWRLKDNAAAFVSRIGLLVVTTVDETWKDATDTVLQVARSELGMTKPGRRKIEKLAWLWTIDEAKKAAKKAVDVAKAVHYEDLSDKLETRDGERHLYRLAKARHRQAEDIEKFLGINQGCTQNFVR